jgi:GR25 family glycosyltransferase involved in LPS biosynthesis
MKFNSKFPVVYPICINLQERKSKKKFMIKQAKKQNIKINFFTATLHKNPKRGCLESHLSVIQNAIDEGHKYLFVLEDDALFTRPLKDLPEPPKDWDMLYLGGTVKHIFTNNEVTKESKKTWIRMTCWTTHAYILNLQKKDLIDDILKAKDQGEDVEIDRYYIDFIHQKYKAYMVHPMTCIQKNGHSDIEKKVVEYKFMEQSLYGLKKPDFEILKDGSYKLKLPDIPNDKLPCVSIITPTRNREWIFSLPAFNFSRFMYPPDKLEWIIIDSSDTDDLKYNFMSEKKIKYLHVPEPCTIAHKRNLACKMAQHPIIVHLDDDDIYPPESILARVKPLMGYKNTECVGCSRIGTYDIINDRSFISSDGHLSLSEASMAYTKKFWEENEFDPGCERGEYYSFIQNRIDRVVDLPYIFVICALNHKRNFTPRTQWVDEKDVSKQVIKNKDTGKVMNFTETWDESTQTFISNLRKYILNSSWYSETHIKNETKSM